ncbi:MAG: glutamate synthase subunit beta [Treponema sp.]|nr:glutamate synthase subunit beta [Treponema sp.]
MGKNDGFLLYDRVEDSWISPAERINNFNEFHNHLDDDERRKQASRCMNCGVPMCQSAIRLSGMVTGCPLHNFIPEWNDALYKKQYDMAAWRLLKTSSFPEFTGRVCPALCEKACNCGNSGDGVANENAVTIHENELYIIERAFESGYMKPQIPKVRSGKKIAVIGSGPAGLAVADLLNRRGHSVTVYERDDRIGGLLMYGIPNMKLDKKIVDRRVELMKAEGVTFITNADVGQNSEADKILSEFDAVALCCGAKQARKLNVLNEDASGVLFAVDFLKSVTKSLINSNLTDEAFFDPKGKHVIVVGGGDTGNDCTGTCVRLGAASVTALEMMPSPPKERQANNPWPEWPKVLKTDYGQQEVIATEGHDPRIYQTTIKEIHTKDGKVCGIKTVQVEFKNNDGQRTLCEIEGSEKELPADLILIAAGFTGAENYTAKAFGVKMTPRNVVATERSDSYATTIPKVFTAGDMHRGQSLVVWAIAEGRECAREIDEYVMGYTNL